MDVLELIAFGAINLACFLMGAKIAQAAKTGETIKTPSVHPVKAYREHEAKKEAKMEQNRIDTILQNIEKYDGTSRGQEDVPGR